jgi:hypothetical protein
MSYVYADARLLHNQEKVGDLECVALIRRYTNAPPAVNWREGDKVLGNKNLPFGTAIATFVDGRYPGKSRGNHSAFYLGQVSDGIYVVDQWPDMAMKPKISKRFIRAKGRKKDGSYVDPSDNASAFSVIK